MMTRADLGFGFQKGRTANNRANDLAGRLSEVAGVIFIDENGDAGPGVRLRKPQRKRP
jgi:hypothetical protein